MIYSKGRSFLRLCHESTGRASPATNHELGQHVWEQNGSPPPRPLGIAPSPFSAYFVFAQLVHTMDRERAIFGEDDGDNCQEMSSNHQQPADCRRVAWTCRVGLRRRRGCAPLCARPMFTLAIASLHILLQGGARLNETPYRSVFITDCPVSAAVDFESLRIIEGSMAVMKGFGAFRLGRIPPHVDYDYQLIDFALMESAMESLQDVALGGGVDGHEARAMQKS